MADEDGKTTKGLDPDLAGFSGHFSTTLTGLKPIRRKQRATISQEISSEEVERAEAEDTGEEPPEEPPAETSEDPSEADAAEASEEPPAVSADDPLESIELRPGLSLVDTAELPIHRSRTGQALSTDQPSDHNRPLSSPPTPPRQTPPVAPGYLDDDSSSARYESRPSSGGLGWLYLLVILLIAGLIGALVLQAVDLL